jgi:hypothetical protein
VFSGQKEREREREKRQVAGQPTLALCPLSIRAAFLSVTHGNRYSARFALPTQNERQVHKKEKGRFNRFALFPFTLINYTSTIVNTQARLSHVRMRISSFALSHITLSI